ncbi:MAG: hypothetical protein WC390_07180 [Sulfurimonas sp.]|jgi:hypothetical protein
MKAKIEELINSWEKESEQLKKLFEKAVDDVDIKKMEWYDSARLRLTICLIDVKKILNEVKS